MNKKHLVLGLVLLAIIGGGTVLIMNRTDTKSPTTYEIKEEDKAKQQSYTFSELQANYPPNPEACEAVTNNPQLSVDPADRTAIESAVGVTIIDMPAGTHFDVYIKNYDKTYASGSVIYESTYGSYNFIAQNMKGVSSDHDTWIISTFVACKN